MARRSIVAIAERSAASKDSTPLVGIADKPVSDACFNDWKRFCFVLRKIASGNNGCTLSGLEAQKRAQAVLTECGYTWPGAPPGARANRRAYCRRNPPSEPS